MDIISNANQAGGIAYLQFNNKPDGRFEAHYELMGLMEGLVNPTFLKDHFQLNDFTPFHDEIRKVSGDFLVGKYVTPLPAGISTLMANSSLGLFHTEAGGQFGFYYLLTRMKSAELPTNTLLQPFLDVQLPDGVGMTFDEQMDGWYFAGQSTSAPDRDGDLTIAKLIPASGDPVGAVPCSFLAHLTIADVNEFIDGYQHEAAMSGSITFGQFAGKGPATFAMNPSGSQFHYLRTNPATGEGEMDYRIEFAADDGRRFTFEGVKYMQKSQTGTQPIADVLQCYTTLYCHVYEHLADGSKQATGVAYLRFRTFENLAAVSNLAGFLASFRVTGTSDPAIQFQARMRFLAFTGQFVEREYDPLAIGTAAHA